MFEFEKPGVHQGAARLRERPCAGMEHGASGAAAAADSGALCAHPDHARPAAHPAQPGQPPYHLIQGARNWLTLTRVEEDRGFFCAN